MLFSGCYNQADSYVFPRFFMKNLDTSIWTRPRTWGVFSFVGVLFVTVSAWADAGETQLFVQNTTHVLRHMHASFQGTAIQHGYSDRELHYGVSVLMGAIGFRLAIILLNQQRIRWQTVLTGFVFGMSPGVAKEFIDMAIPHNYFSWRDITYNAAGVLTGLIIVWMLVRVLARSREPLSH